MLPTYLEHLTSEELTARIAKLEEMGKAQAARLASGEQSEISTYANVFGRQVALSRLQHSIEWNRTTLEQAREEIRRREMAI